MKTQFQIEAMSDEECRIKTAELCGWHECAEPLGSKNDFAWWWNETRYPSYDKTPFPDYLNSLDAMHEAEKELDEQSCWQLYEECLHAVWLQNEDGRLSRFKIHATARQRNTAFLMVMLNDKEDKP